MTRSSHVHYEALVKIFLLNAVILPVGNTILYINDPIIIIYNQCLLTVGMKTVATMHRHHYKPHFTITAGFFQNTGLRPC